MGNYWSTRLWQDMALVQKEVEKTTSNVLLRGRHPNEYVSEFKKQTNSTTYNTSRLLVTESARVQAESQKLTYLKELGEDGEYKYVAKIDKKTSKICHSLNGKVFKVKDMIPGINAPPMHPWCRSTTVPHVGNWRDKFFNKRKDKYQIKDYLSESGALTNKNDEYGVKRRKHAKTYYNSVKNRDKQVEIKTIAKNANMNEKAINRVYEHLFENKYLLDYGIKQFDPDFYMAQSWQRLREGKNIEPMDIIMLKHEALEHFLMNKYNLSYKEAHILSEKNIIIVHLLNRGEINCSF